MLSECSLGEVGLDYCREGISEAAVICTSMYISIHASITMVSARNLHFFSSILVFSLGACVLLYYRYNM